MENLATGWFDTFWAKIKQKTSIKNKNEYFRIKRSPAALAFQTKAISPISVKKSLKIEKMEISNLSTSVQLFFNYRINRNLLIFDWLADLILESKSNF